MSETSKLRPEVQSIVDAIRAIKDIQPFEVFYLRTLLKPPAGSSVHATKRAAKSAPKAKKAAPRKVVKAAKAAASAES